MVSALVCGLIREKRIKTTIRKAKIAQRAAEKMVTLARKDTVAARRLAASRLGQKECVQELFLTIVPQFEGRPGGYTRIIKVGTRRGDAAEMALLEWVGIAPAVKAKPAENPEAAA